MGYGERLGYIRGKEICREEWMIIGRGNRVFRKRNR